MALPASVLLAGAGIALGTFATIVQHAEAGGVLGKFARRFSSLPIGSDAFIYILLPALLFQSALTIEVPQMLEDAAPILLLAIVAVVVATVVIGFALAPFAGVSIIACLALGAIVATTDPVAVIAIFRDVGAPSRLIRLVEGESLLNDAAAITLFAALLEWLLGGHHSAAATAVEFVRTLLGGVVIGLIGARRGRRAAVVAARPPAGAGDADARAALRRLHRRTSTGSTCPASSPRSRRVWS